MSSDEEVRAAEDASAVAADAVADDPYNGEKDSGSDGAEAKEGERKRERKERKERPAPRPAVPIKVGELRPGTSGHHVTVKVLAHKTVVDRPRGDGSNLLIAESVVGDDTGVIVFTARGKQVDALKEGAVLELRNAKIDMFKGSMRLGVDKWGVVEAATDAASIEVNEDNNMSAVQYELVTVDKGDGN